jgi:hypothetical protein
MTRVPYRRNPATKPVAKRRQTIAILDLELHATRTDKT